jgi:hypothetical protein
MNKWPHRDKQDCPYSSLYLSSSSYLPSFFLVAEQKLLNKNKTTTACRLKSITVSCFKVLSDKKGDSESEANTKLTFFLKKLQFFYAQILKPSAMNGSGLKEQTAANKIESVSGF